MVLRLIHENNEVPLWEKYDNLQDINSNPRLRCALGFGLDFRFGVSNPNEFQSVRQRTRIYTDGFNDHIKHKNVSNEIYLLNEDCEL